MGASRLTDDQAAEILLKRIDQIRSLAAQIGEDDAVEQIEDIFQEILNRWLNKRIDALNRQCGDAGESGGEFFGLV